MRTLLARLSYVGLFGAALQGCGDGAPPPEMERAHEPFSTVLSGDPVHEKTTSDGLPFLKTDVVTWLQFFNDLTDLEFFNNNAYHFDDCNFSGGSRTVAAEQRASVAALDPLNDTPETTLNALRGFARSLHTSQDFYAHSNWVELGQQILVNDALTPWQELAPYSALTPDEVVVVQGSAPAGTALTRSVSAPYPDDAIVTVRRRTTTRPGLISGTVDYEPGDFCPRQISMTHDALNKDHSTDTAKATQHAQARALATQQTTHEWCRLLTQTRAQWGDAGDRRLFTWVKDERAASRCGEATDLALASAGTPATQIGSGDDAQYDFTFSNEGSVASFGTVVRVRATAPLALVSAKATLASCSVSATGVDCYVGQLVPGARGTLQVVVHAAAAGSSTVNTTISGHVSDTNPNNDTVTVNVDALE